MSISNSFKLRGDIWLWYIGIKHADTYIMVTSTSTHCFNIRAQIETTIRNPALYYFKINDYSELSRHLIWVS